MATQTKKKATTVGATVGTTAGGLATWLALEAETKWGVPHQLIIPFAAVFSGALFTTISRWAAKLDPTR